MTTLPKKLATSKKAGLVKQTKGFFEKQLYIVSSLLHPLHIDLITTTYSQSYITQVTQLPVQVKQALMNLLQ